ncbi:MAG TPA: type I-E CRISPR-associated protein Cse2/CasB [Chthoniobacterales bacterium]|nr:type I-E CRISPR-associated protein Cse2/CasB [Chthoniobacterales bacterium]
MNPAPPTETKDLALVRFLSALKREDDRGTLALLRGALGDSAERQIRAWRVLARFGGIPSDDLHRAEVVRTVAGLLALPRLNHAGAAGSFGKVCRRLLGDEERKSLDKAAQPGPISRRMQHLLAGTRGEVCDRVRQLGRRLDVEGATLDFNRLHSDLLYWPRPKSRWAADFWGAGEEEKPTSVMSEAAP